MGGGRENKQDLWRHKPSKHAQQKSKQFQQQPSSWSKQSVDDMCSPCLLSVWQTQLQCVSRSINNTPLQAPVLGLAMLGTAGPAEDHLRAFNPVHKIRDKMDHWRRVRTSPREPGTSSLSLTTTTNHNWIFCQCLPLELWEAFPAYPFPGVQNPASWADGGDFSISWCVPSSTACSEKFIPRRCLPPCSSYWKE